MELDLASFSVSATAGAIIWELFKQLLGSRFKRSGDKQAAKRRQLSEQCAAAKGRVNSCMQWSVEYLTAACTLDRKSELNRTLRHEVSLLGQSIVELNMFASDLGLTQVQSFHMISFRRAVTWRIDSRSYKPQPHDCADVNEVYSSGFTFQEALTQLQLRCA